MRHQVGSYDWEKDWKNLYCEEGWKIFEEKGSRAINLYVPKSSCSTRKPGKHLWINDSDLKKVRKKSESFTSYLYRLVKAQSICSMQEQGIKPNGSAKRR